MKCRFPTLEHWTTGSTGTLVHRGFAKRDHSGNREFAEWVELIVAEAITFAICTPFVFHPDKTFVPRRSLRKGCVSGAGVCWLHRLARCYWWSVEVSTWRSRSATESAPALWSLFLSSLARCQLLSCTL